LCVSKGNVARPTALPRRNVIVPHLDPTNPNPIPNLRRTGHRHLATRGLGLALPVRAGRRPARRRGSGRRGGGHGRRGLRVRVRVRVRFRG